MRITCWLYTVMVKPILLHGCLVSWSNISQRQAITELSRIQNDLIQANIQKSWRTQNDYGQGRITVVTFNTTTFKREEWISREKQSPNTQFWYTDRSKTGVVITFELRIAIFFNFKHIFSNKHVC